MTARSTEIVLCPFRLGSWAGWSPNIAATENVRYIAAIYGLDADYVEAFCRWLCDIGEYFDMPIGTYSSGMRARLSLALMLAMNFDLYLIDEGMPTTTDVAFKQAGRGGHARTLLNARLW